MKTNKLLTMLALAALPFLAGCASPSEKIRRSIQMNVPVNRQDVSAALAEGESPWALHDEEETFSLFEYAVGENDTDLIDFCLSNKSLSPELAEAQCSAYVERVLASLSADKDSNDELSVCEKIWNAELALSTKPKLEAKLKQVAEERATKFVESVIDEISVDSDADDDDLACCREYWEKGLALAAKPKLEAKLKQVAEERATKFVESVIDEISVDSDADEEDLARCREYWNKGLALSVKPKLEAKLKQVEEERATRFVEFVIDKITINGDASEDDLACCREYWEKGMALSTKPKLEARQKLVAEERKRLAEERKRLAEEQERLAKERREKARLDALKEMERAEKQSIRRRLLQEIFPSERKLSEEERSRGWTLLETFGEEQMPALAEKCKAARRNYLEADANLESLTAALKDEGTDIELNRQVVRFAAENQVSGAELKSQLNPEIIPKVNDVFLAASMRVLDLAADYWFLRYKLTDFYSQFKIGAATSDELAAADEELAERL